MKFWGKLYENTRFAAVSFLRRVAGCEDVVVRLVRWKDKTHVTRIKQVGERKCIESSCNSIVILDAGTFVSIEK